MHKLITSILIAVCFTLSIGASRSRGLAQSPGAVQPGKPQAAVSQKRAPVDPDKFAIVIAGAGGEQAYTKKFTAQAMELYGALTNRLGFDEKNVFLLTEALGGGPEN